MLTLNVYTDGGARGNPGKSAIAGMLYIGGERVKWFAEKIGFATNNQAEYKALIRALTMAKEFLPVKVVCHSDSEIVVKQMRREYKCKNLALQQLFGSAKALERLFDSIEYVHLPRENSRISGCDFMLNEVLDGKELVAQ